MLARLAIALVAGCVLAAVPAPPPALAADPVVARDTLIQFIWPLDGDLVYFRDEYGKPVPERRWMARFRGHLHQARGIPRQAGGGSIGRDAEGRKVFVFAVARSGGGGGGWFVYGLASNRTHAMTGLSNDPGFPSVVGVWRDSLAYTTRCQDEEYPTLFVRKGNRTRRVSSLGGYPAVTYRAGIIAVIVDDGLDNTYLEQWMANGKKCVKRIDTSFGSDDVWYPADLWIANGYVIWTMGAFALRPNFAILAAKVAPGCAAPGPVGLFPFRPKVKTLRTVAVDERRVFYADDKTLRRHSIPAKPSLRPPPNDNFKNAKRLSGHAPLTATGNVAHATTQHGEPLARTKHTVWYAYRPTKSGTVYVTVSGSCRE